ncbi:MAG: hypothetical protein H8D23_25990 [Candidatus Brocadiales bacterium]|nr:hypothetical protein [Candidatus Brocadiales bacterium]
MIEEQRKRLLFIDPHKYWLDFVVETLARDYDVHVASNLVDLPEIASEDLYFDLIFIGLSLAEENISKLSDLARSAGWHFIVLYPGSPDGITSRIFFKAGMRDLLSKPYDSDSLKMMVENEISTVDQYTTKRTKGAEVKNDYSLNVLRLWKSIYTASSNSL